MPDQPPDTPPDCISPWVDEVAWIAPASPQAVMATKVSPIGDAYAVGLGTASHSQPSALIAHKEIKLQYGKYGSAQDTAPTCLVGTLYLVDRREYENNVELRFFASTNNATGSDVPANYASTRNPWLLLHPKHGRTWIHEGWLIYDFDRPGLTIGQHFVAITFDQASFDATESLSNIGTYTIDCNYLPSDVHAAHTIVALPMFQDTYGLDPAAAHADNSVALQFYNTLQGGRLRKVSGKSHLASLVEYPPRPVSKETMQGIKLISNHMGYPVGGLNAFTPKRCWLTKEPAVATVVDQWSGTLKPHGQLYGLRGNEAIFRPKAWEKLCFVGEGHLAEIPTYWQAVYEDQRVFSPEAEAEITQAAQLRLELDQKKRDSWMDTPNSMVENLDGGPRDVAMEVCGA